MLRWSTRASEAISIFYEPLQDIDIYVEDINDEAFYKNLINRIVDGAIRIEKVFPLGGRLEVLRKCRAHDHSARRAFFMIDGDLKFTKGQAAEYEHPALHVLQAYCIENLIFCENAAVRIMIEECDIDADSARSNLDFSSWIASILSGLVRLFSAYATCNEFSPTFPTVKNGVMALCSHVGKYPQIDLQKVDAMISEALENAKKSGASGLDIQAFNAAIEVRLNNMGDPLLAISGKDILLPLLMYRLGNLGCSIKMEKLRRRLSLGCNLEYFSALRNHLLHVAQAKLIVDGAN